MEKATSREIEGLKRVMKSTTKNFEESDILQSTKESVHPKY
jgi:hypothetical protein